MDQTIADILSQCKLFAQVAAGRCQKLAEYSVRRTFAKGQMIFRQGQDCPGVYVVASGMIRIFKTGPSGKEHVLHMVGPKHTFAEIAAIGDFPCPAHAQAVSTAVCVLVPMEPFRAEIARDHQLCLEMMTGLSTWVHQLIALMEDLVLRDAAGRVARYLLDLEPEPDGTVKLPSLKRYVASHLNLTSETLSRTLSRLIEAGLVTELDQNRVELQGRDQLRGISEGNFPGF